MRGSARLVAMALTVLAWAPSAHADEPYRVRAEVDGPVLGIGTVVAAGWLLRHQLSPAWCSPKCDPEKLNALDRRVAGNWNPTWSRASDVGIGVLIAAAITVPVLDAGVPELVIVSEALILSDAVATVADVGVRRPRPFLYGESAPVEERTDGNASLSFFSGHTTVSFATSLSVFSILHKRHPRSPWPWVWLGGSLSAGVFVAAGRMISGNHFPTDVLAGAVVGASAGILLPALHEAGLPSTSVTPVVTSELRGLAFSTAF